MPNILKITGGKQLSGEITPVPNKNAMLPALAASVLTSDTVTYHNLPKSTDVVRMLDALRILGAEVDDHDFSLITVNCKNIKTYEIDSINGNAMRSSILFAGPLLARFGKARIPLPGGCVLGRRSIAAHIDAFAKVGVTTEISDGFANFERTTPLLKHYSIWMMEASVTATENIAMYAAGCEAEFDITEAAAEPHVTQLIKLLEEMGATVSGLESNKLCITGKNVFASATFIPEPDQIDIAGIIIATAITKGKLVVKGANIPRVSGGLVQFFQKWNIGITTSGEDLIIDGTKDLVINCAESGFPLAGDDLPKVSPRPWPGFPVDALPSVVTLARKTHGKTLIQNWMYETGLDFIRELNVLGANIFMADPQRVIVTGPINFTGGKVVSPSIIQAAQAIFLAALADPVETKIESWEVIKRRYPEIIDVYRKLGATIEEIAA